MPKTIPVFGKTGDETLATPQDVSVVDAKAVAAQATADDALSKAGVAQAGVDTNSDAIAAVVSRVAALEAIHTVPEPTPEPDPTPEPTPEPEPIPAGESPIPGGPIPVLSQMYESDIPVSVERVKPLPVLATDGVTVSSNAELVSALDGGAKAVALVPGSYALNLTDKVYDNAVVTSADMSNRAVVDLDLLRCRGVFARGLDLPGVRIVGSERCGILSSHVHSSGRYTIELDTDLDSGPGCKDIWIRGNYIVGGETGIYSRRGVGIEVAENFFADIRSDLIKFAGTDVYEVRDNRNNGRWVGTGDAAHIDCFQCLNSDYHDGVIRGNFFYYDVIEGQSSGKTVQGFLLQGTNKRIAVLGNLLFLRSVHGLTTDADDSIAKWNTMISHEDADAPTMLVRMKGGGNVVSQNVDNWGEAPKDQYASLFPNATRGPNKILADFKHLGSIANKGAWELVEHGGA